MHIRIHTINNPVFTCTFTHAVDHRDCVHMHIYTIYIYIQVTNNLVMVCTCIAHMCIISAQEYENTRAKLPRAPRVPNSLGCAICIKGKRLKSDKKTINDDAFLRPQPFPGV